jgi:hypothetical protein
MNSIFGQGGLENGSLSNWGGQTGRSVNGSPFESAFKSAGEQAGPTTVNAHDLDPNEL